MATSAPGWPPAPGRRRSPRRAPRPTTDRGGGRAGRSAAPAGRWRRTRARRSTGTSRRPRPAAPGGRAARPPYCRDGTTAPPGGPPPGRRSPPPGPPPTPAGPPPPPDRGARSRTPSGAHGHRGDGGAGSPEPGTGVDRHGPGPVGHGGQLPVGRDRSGPVARPHLSGPATDVRTGCTGASGDVAGATSAGSASMAGMVPRWLPDRRTRDGAPVDRGATEHYRAPTAVHTCGRVGSPGGCRCQAGHGPGRAHGDVSRPEGPPWGGLQ